VHFVFKVPLSGYMSGALIFFVGVHMALDFWNDKCTRRQDARRFDKGTAGVNLFFHFFFCYIPTSWPHRRVFGYYGESRISPGKVNQKYTNFKERNLTLRTIPEIH
jgi:hypothetical protein